MKIMTNHHGCCYSCQSCYNLFLYKTRYLKSTDSTHDFSLLLKCKWHVFFWDFRKHKVASSYQRFRNDKLSWNIGKKVLCYAM